MPVAANAKEETKNDGGGGAKKRRGPAVLMEGSRCSRVNGRGWRCSQPTLVGYSLCEHHLGKGRMRSVTGGRGGAASSAAPSRGRTPPPPLSPRRPRRRRRRRLSRRSCGHARRREIDRSIQLQDSFVLW